MEAKTKVTRRRKMLLEFLNHAPKTVCDFEKALKNNDIEQAIYLSKVNRTLFHQIGEADLAHEFDEIKSESQFDKRVTDELIRMAKRLISDKEHELDKMDIFHSKITADTELDINLYQLKLLKDSTPGFVFDIIDLYGQQNVEYLVVMENALKRSEFEKARKIAHTMKSSFVMIGCNVLKSLAIEIELLCEAENPNRNELLERFKDLDLLVKNSIHLLKKTAKSENLL